MRLLELRLRHAARLGHAVRAARGAYHAAERLVLVLLLALREDEREVGGLYLADERALVLLERAHLVDERALRLRERLGVHELARAPEERNRYAEVRRGAPRRLPVAGEHSRDVRHYRPRHAHAVAELAVEAELCTVIVSDGVLRDCVLLLRVAVYGRRGGERAAEYCAKSIVGKIELERRLEERLLLRLVVRAVVGGDPHGVDEPDLERVRPALPHRERRILAAIEKPVSGAPVEVRRDVADSERRGVVRIEVLVDHEAPAQRVRRSLDLDLLGAPYGLLLILGEVRLPRLVRLAAVVRSAPARGEEEGCRGDREEPAHQ